MWTQSAAKQPLSNPTVQEAKSIFFARLNHELRTPSNAILGYGEILREKAEGEGRLEDLCDLKRIKTAGPAWPWCGGSATYSEAM